MDNLPEDVIAELEDERFNTRTHGKRATAGVGCNGPLCRKAERDAAHEKYSRKRQRAGKPPARVGLRDEKARERDELLEGIQLWHERVRELAKLNRLVQPDLTPEELEEAV